MTKVFAAFSALALVMTAGAAAPAAAQGKKSGWGETTVNTTGGSGKYNPKASSSSTTTYTTTGPKGQLQTGGTTNVTTTKTNRPGRNMP
ncbi:MAG TPA: hypothetical protein VM434_07260 [Beijerinckiaceae bacterium]|nr:hypothetical protein [Beijerinckiaceae bacterium]